MSVHASLKECSVPIKTDFLSKRANEVPAEHEILIGKTNREESLDVLDSLDTSDPDKIFYTVLAVNGKLVIIGAMTRVPLKPRSSSSRSIIPRSSGRSR